MPKRKSHSEDENQMAFRILNEHTSNLDTTKNPHAVALGRMGGLRGGIARKKALSARRRKEIARKAGIASGKSRRK